MDENTGTIMIVSEVEVDWNPIFDSIVRDMGLDPFDDMQLVEVEENGVLITLDAIDMSMPPAWMWPDDEVLNLPFDGMLATLLARQKVMQGLSDTGVYRLVTSPQLALPAAPEPAEPTTVTEWINRFRPRPQTLTDTMAMPPVDPYTDTSTSLLGLLE